MVLLTLTGILISLYLIDNPHRKHARKEKTFMGQTTGQITRVEPMRKLEYTDWGNETVVIYYQIEYGYSLKNRYYTGVDYLPNHRKYAGLLKKLRQQQGICVRYNLYDPTQSVLCWSANTMSNK